MRRLIIIPAAMLTLTGTAAFGQHAVPTDRDAAHDDRIQDQKQAVKAHEARLVQQDRVQDHREQERARDQVAFHAKEKERLAYEARHHTGDHDHDKDDDRH